MQRVSPVRAWCGVRGVERSTFCVRYRLPVGLGLVGGSTWGAVCGVFAPVTGEGWATSSGIEGGGVALRVVVGAGAYELYEYWECAWAEWLPSASVMVEGRVTRFRVR